MIRALLRTVVIVVILVAAAAFFLGYRWSDGAGPALSRDPVATTGVGGQVDRDRARQTGAAIGEKVAVGASRAEQVIAESTLTAKIKAKIALDETLRGTRVNVDSHGSEVTLRGTVATRAQRQRVAQLARETAGVTAVEDQLTVQ